MEFLDGLEHYTRENEPLAPYTWFRLGGVAQYFAEPTTIDELAALVRRCRQEQLPIRLLGGGSNLLIRDAGIEGMVIHLTAATFAGISVEGQIVKAGGAAKLGHVVSSAVGAGLAGLEPLVGIPGSIGGALHGNASTQGGDIGQWTHSATVMTHDGEIETRTRDSLIFAHRQSSLDDLVILEAQFALEPDDPREITQRMQKLWIIKKAHEPATNECAGLIFRDPGGDTAASLIESAGFKNARVGEARIDDRNANFITVESGATTDDVLRLIELVRTGVSDRTGVELELNLEIW